MKIVVAFLIFLHRAKAIMLIKLPGIPISISKIQLNEASLRRKGEKPMKTSMKSSLLSIRPIYIFVF
jgi:hypothetical protein